MQTIMFPNSIFQNCSEGHNATTKNLVSVGQNPTINNSNSNTILSISPIEPTNNQYTEVLPNESNVVISPSPSNYGSMSYLNLMVIIPTPYVSYISKSDVSQPTTNVHHQIEKLKYL